MLEVEGLEELASETYHTFIAPEYVERLENERARAWTGFMSSYELALVGKSGQKRPVIMSGGPVLSAEGEPHSLIGAFTDITKRKQAELALQRTARLSAIGELAAGVAHQINNPLFTVITDSHLLLEQLPSDSPAYESAAAIQRAASRAGDVVQRLLDFSRAQPSTARPVDVNASIRQAVDLIRVQIEPHIARLVVELAPQLPFIEASEEHLQDVWINLLLNARDAVGQSENAMIQITTKLNVEREMIEIVIEDNGMGISEEALTQIFTPFFTTKTRGTGLGLAVCYDIVRYHGGSISVKSALSQGATFIVSLPIHGVLRS
jgi:signal transduction histidine kinase